MAALEATGGNSHGVVEKTRCQKDHNCSEHHWGADNLNRHTHQNGHENTMSELGNAMRKYELHLHTHNANNHHIVQDGQHFQALNSWF